AEETHARADAEVLRGCHEPLAKRAVTDDHEARARQLAQDSRGGEEEARDALLRNEARDRSDHRIVRREPTLERIGVAAQSADGRYRVQERRSARPGDAVHLR